MKMRATINAIKIPQLVRVYGKDRSTILEYKHSIADHRCPDRTR